MQVKGDNFFLHGGSITLVQNPINVRYVVSTNVNKLNFANTVCDGISEAQTFIYNTNGASIKAYAPDNFEIALQDGGYTSRVTLQPTTIAGHTIYVRMKPGVVPDSADGEIIFIDTVTAETSPYKVYVRGYKHVNLELGGSIGNMVHKTLLALNSGNLFTEPGTCKVLAKLTPAGAAPVSDSVTTKLWIENTIPLFGNTPFVTRHAEILPASNASTATGRVRLYFSQTEFNAFNAGSYSLLDLPVGPADAAGIANLRIYKFIGSSIDGSGKPYTYSNYTIINPADVDITWNTAGNFWQVDFDVTGFGHFYAGTDLTVNACTNGLYRLQADNSGIAYQWQRNTGSGFVNLTNGGIHSGATTRELIIISPLSSGYGHQYRCVVDGIPSASIYTLKFVSTWLGNTNTNWNTSTNWAACNTLPDQYTDVVIPPGRTNYPILNTNRTIRSLRSETGSSVTVQPGVTLTVVGN